MDKINSLQVLANERLATLLRQKCILLDAPYYHNIGDVLIWAGTQSFIEANGIRCLYTASYETCTFPKISEDVVVLFNGGGNLGDLYHEHVEFLKAVVRHYPNNRIIVLPQTVYYGDKAVMDSDFEFLARHDDFYFCARDKVVFESLKNYFGSKTLLVPDMAFCIDFARLKPYLLPISRDKLVVDRIDCEKGGGQLCVDGDVSDWPVFEHSFRKSTFVNKLFKRVSDLRIPVLSKFCNLIWNWYASSYFQKAMIKEGVRFISPYKRVETTRLHGAILSILLGKEVVLVDNSYGKNKNFYDTWLSGFDNVSLKD